MKKLSELRIVSGITAAHAVLMTSIDMISANSYCRDSGLGALSLVVAGLSITTFVLANKAKEESESLERIEEMRRRGDIE